MKLRISKFVTLLNLILILVSCNGQTNQKKIDKKSTIGKMEQPSGDVYRGFLDKDNNLWFGTNNDGLYKYDNSNFIHFTELDGILNKKISCIYQANNGDLWFGTTDGVFIYNGTEFTHLKIPKTELTTDWLKNSFPAVNPNEVQSINQDKNGIFWLGTNGAGAYRYDGKVFTNHLVEIGKTMPDGLHHNIIQSITRDKNGDLWFASMSHGGVNRFNGKEFTQYQIKDGLSDSQVRTIYCDKLGTIWMGFNGNRNSGLTTYNGKSFKTFSEVDGLCNTRVRAIFEDKNGNIWLGAQFGNLCIFDGEKFSEFNFKEQTFSDVFFIVGDLKDNIWFGGKHGIWKFDGQIITEITTNE